MRLIDLLENAAAEQPERAAMICAGPTFSYGRIRRDVNCLADKLRKAGCREGTKAAIVFDNSPEYLVSFFAVSAAGGTIVPLPGRMTTYEARRHVRSTDSSIVITGIKNATDLFGDWGSDQAALVTADYNAACELEIGVSGVASEPDGRDRDVALMVLTSGTTNRSKIVMLTADQLIWNMRAYIAAVGFNAYNIVYCAVPMYHVYCICAQILTHMSRADTFVIRRGPFFVRDFASAVAEYSVTGTAFVPYIAAQLANLPQGNSYNMSSLEFVTLSGSRTPVSILRILRERYKHTRFMNAYGMSEAGSRISIPGPRPQDFPIESAGRPIPGVKVRIVGEDNRPVIAGLEGEIQAKSPSLMKGYYRQPGLTSETVVDGWLRTGDIGRVDAEGNLFVVGRKKNIINVGGENVYPDEIEECLLEHPAVNEAAVVGAPDRALEEVPYAYIAAKSPQRPSAAEIVAFCRKRLSAHKTPRKIEYLDVLPRTDTMKIDRKRLRQMAADTYSDAART